MNKENKYEFKEIQEMLVASIRKPAKSRSELKSRFEKLKKNLGDRISGPAFLIVHYDTPVEDGFNAEVGYPLSKEFEIDELKSRRCKES